jgi:hypothetical protein
MHRRCTGMRREQWECRAELERQPRSESRLAGEPRCSRRRWRARAAPRRISVLRQPCVPSGARSWRAASVPGSQPVRRPVRFSPIGGRSISPSPRRPVDVIERSAAPPRCDARRCAARIGPRRSPRPRVGPARWPLPGVRRHCARVTRSSTRCCTSSAASSSTALRRASGACARPKDRARGLARRAAAVLQAVHAIRAPARSILVVDAAPP